MLNDISEWDQHVSAKIQFWKRQNEWKGEQNNEWGGHPGPLKTSAYEAVCHLGSRQDPLKLHSQVCFTQGPLYNAGVNWGEAYSRGNFKQFVSQLLNWPVSYLSEFWIKKSIYVILD